MQKSFDDPHSGPSWDTLRLFLEGFSPVDLKSLAITGRQEAEEFIAVYGYDLSDPRERDEAGRIHQEALSFIERFLCPSLDDDSEDLEIPIEVAEPQHLAELLLLPSDPSKPILGAWACAVLRVMHTISHANLAARTPYFRDVQEQILTPFMKHIFPSPNEPRSLGQGKNAVPLKAAFFKKRKSRESLILKLLHKPDNVASEVYDRIGIKLITNSKVDALLALRYLRNENLVSLPLLTPGRSRNTLVDLEGFQEAYEMLSQMHDSPETNGKTIELLNGLSYRPGRESELLEERLDSNPHSSPGFRSIQFTCRKLVKVTHPAVTVINQLRKQTGNDLLGIEVERHYPKQLRFTFPFEIQITDWENYLASREGESSHVAYKRRQLAAARRRVLGEVLLEEAKKKRAANAMSRKILSFSQIDPDGGHSEILPVPSTEGALPPVS